MNIRRILFFTTSGLLAATAPLLHAQGEEGDARLREALRTTTAQLRTAQSELAVAQSELERAREQTATLERRIEALTRQAAADQAAAQDNIREVREELAAKESENQRLAASLLEWTSAHEDVAAIARTKDRELREANNRVTDLRNELAQVRSHNRELHRIGLDVLDRFENFALGRAIGAREPFTRNARARIQTLVQDYLDELNDNRISLDSTEGN